MENGAFTPKEQMLHFPYFQKWKMEHLLQKSKCSISHIFKNMIFQRRQKALLWGKELIIANFNVNDYSLFAGHVILHVFTI